MLIKADNIMEKKRWMTNIKNAIEGKSRTRDKTVKGQQAPPKNENTALPALQRKDSVVQPVTGDLFLLEKN
jgi:hypothetical protein